jgi:hypothetical protein
VRRRLFNLLTTLSLVLYVAACVLWVRSYWALDALSWTRADNAGGQRYSWFRIIASGRGHFACSCDAEVYELGAITPQEAARPTGRWRWEGWERGRPGDAVPAFGGTPNLGWGFHFAWHHDPAGVRREGVVPYWAVALFTVLLPAGRTAARFHRGPGHRNGHCPRCGYDLRATPDRCPECGKPAVATPT